MAILTLEPTQTANALQALYGPEYKTYCGEWKKLLDEEQSEALVRMLAEMSNRDTTAVRFHLRNNETQPETAVQLYTGTDVFRREWAVLDKLARPEVTRRRPRQKAHVIKPSNPIYKPWMEGTTEEQRLDIIATVRMSCDCQEHIADMILNHDSVRGVKCFGLNILKFFNDYGADVTREYIYKKIGFGAQ
ncbi:hypothetical protein CBS101457_000220 [Exobasidium rhododendri]|nr:hypothetical protein CBS101457_000220 [Exobasidium rhododendri]